MNIKENAEYFKFLFNLQRSGRTNMFGAGPFLQTKFGMDKSTASTVLAYWMNNYEIIAAELAIEI